MLSPGAQWSLLVNGSWRYLGSELSTLLETAHHRRDSALDVASYFKVFGVLSYFITIVIFLGGS